MSAVVSHCRDNYARFAEDLEHMFPYIAEQRMEKAQLRRSVVSTMYVNKSVADGEDICGFRHENPRDVDSGPS